MALVGVPVIFLEMALGQFTSNGPMTCWQFAPIVHGIGYAMCWTKLMTTLFYNMYPAKALIYICITVASLGQNLPWLSCDHDFNTPYCLDVTNKPNCTDPGIERNLTDGVCYNTSTHKFHGIWDDKLARSHGVHYNLSSEEYLDTYISGKSRSTGLGDLGGLNWELSVAYSLTWLIILFVNFRGIKSLVKVLYFTVIFPYPLLIILLVQGLLTDKDGAGVAAYLGNVDFDKLKTAAPWRAAASNVHFSLGGAYGAMVFLASHNRFHHDFFTDAMILAGVAACTSLLGGFVVYPYLAQLSKSTGFSFQDLTHSNTQLLFVSYPAAMATNYIYVPHVWVILFYVMIVLISVDTVFVTIESTVTALCDLFPGLRKYNFRMLIMTCTACFLIGLMFCTDGGAYGLKLLEHYVGSWNVIFLASMETLCVVFIYGVKRLRADIEVMLGHRACWCVPWGPCSWYWFFCWNICTPIGLVSMTIYEWALFKPLKDEWYVYPDWANALGWLLSMSVMTQIIVTAVYKLYIAKGTLRQRIKYLTTPTVYWGPALVKHRKYFKYLPDWILDPYGGKRKNGAKPRAFYVVNHGKKSKAKTILPMSVKEDYDDLYA